MTSQQHIEILASLLRCWLNPMNSKDPANWSVSGETLEDLIQETRRALVDVDKHLADAKREDCDRMRSERDVYKDSADGWKELTYQLAEDNQELRGLLREAIENGGATSTVMHDPAVRGCTRIVWDGKEWEKRAREALGDD
jgi:hypothetical protein